MYNSFFQFGSSLCGFWCLLQWYEASFDGIEEYDDGGDGVFSFFVICVYL